MLVQQTSREGRGSAAQGNKSDNKMAESGVVSRTVVFPFNNYRKWERKPLCSPSKHQSTKHSSLPQPKNDRLFDKMPTSPKKCVELDISVLKAQITAKKSLIKEFKKLRDQLLAANFALIASIQQTESSTLGEVTGLLERYGTFKDAIAAVRRRSTRDLEEAKCELEATKTRVDREILDLKEQGERVANLVRPKAQDVNLLLHYKEKEYPVKLLRMQRLKEQSEALSEMSEMELAELEHEAEAERGLWQQQLLQTKTGIEEKAAKASVERIQEGVREKALHNKIMEKEIIFHREKATELSRGIETLKEDISHVKQAIQEDRQKCKVLPLMAIRCLPDSEVQLDIPLRRP